MTFDDARKILNGSDTAATDYFKSKTTKKLQTAFLRASTERDESMSASTASTTTLSGAIKSVPFSKSITFDVNQYVTEKTIDGLFSSSPRRRKKISTNPAARVNDLLKEVFGSRK